jgi:hypothetical protein
MANIAGIGGAFQLPKYGNCHENYVASYAAICRGVNVTE